MRHSWLRDFARRVFGSPRRRKGTIGYRKPAERKPAVEVLEIRLVPATFIVANTNDTGAGSLRQAILDSNTAGGSNTINFAIAASGVQTIFPNSDLPTITTPVVIDGTTEPGYAGTPIVVIKAAAGSPTANGLTIAAPSTTAQGLVIEGFTGAGIVITANNALIRNDYIGIAADGATADGNGAGIQINGGGGSTVGGTTVADRNVISGNFNDGIDIGATVLNLVEGNYIGTNAAGTAAVANQGSGVVVNSTITFGNTIGGSAPGAGNVISGNKQNGLNLAGDSDTIGNLVAGNIIGLNAAGTAALGNKFFGVRLSGAGVIDNTIGGTTAGFRNFISGNGDTGIIISNAGTGNIVAGNYIGTDITGSTALGNGIDGIDLFANDATIGGTAAGAGNVISANAIGVALDTASGNVIAGNFIGTNAAGTAALGNVTGIFLGGSSANNTVGGTTADSRNLISGNTANGLNINGAGATGNVIAGNYVGTNAAGTAVLANGGDGVEVDTDQNTVGGTTAGEGNVLSGNVNDGLFLAGNNNFVVGNFVGTNAAGSAAIANGSYGIDVFGANNTVGGSAAGARNVISGNTGDGVLLDGASGNLIQGNSIGINQAGTLALANGRYGVNLGSPNNTIDSNVISGNASDGVNLQGNFADGTLITGNLIGTSPVSGVLVPNLGDGIVINNSSNNTVGGATAAARNVISGNAWYGIIITTLLGLPTPATDNLVVGNYIGTDAAGTGALPDGLGGVLLQADTGDPAVSGNTIGGTTAVAANVISGNFHNGVYLSGDSVTANVVAGNFIGTTAAGTVALPNAGNGVILDQGAHGNTIGGTGPGARNVISGNLLDGIDVTGGGTSGNVIVGNYVGTTPGGRGLLPGTVAWYPLDGNLNDVVGGFNGTLHQSSPGSLLVPGEVGQAAQFTTNSFFDGPDRSFSVPDATPTVSTALEPANGLTVETWLNAANPDPAGIPIVYLLEKGEDTGNNHNSYSLTAVDVAGVEQLAFSIFTTGNNTFTVQTTTSPFDGAWHHVAATFDGSKITLYVDGAAVSAPVPTDGNPIHYDLTDSTLPSSGGLHANDLVIGGSPDDALPDLYNGSLDELGIYNRALSPSEILGIYSAGSVGKGNNVGNQGNGVTISAQGNTVGGNGGGTLSNLATLPTGTGAFVPVKSVVGDFNGDNRTDVVTVLHAASGDELSVSLGNGDGTFQPPIETNVTGAFNGSPDDLLAVDLNNDGRLDLVGVSTAAAGSNFLTLFLGNGDGSFQAFTKVQATSNLGGQITSAAVGDFNGDGRPDLVVADQLNSQVDVLLNAGGSGPTFNRVTSTTVSKPLLLVAADFDNDGRLDVAALELNNTVDLLLGDNLGHLVSNGFPRAAGAGATVLRAGDIDGDAFPDVAVGHADGSVLILLRPESILFSGAVALQAGTDVQDMAVGDFDGNGHADIAVTNQTTGTVTYLLGQGNLVFQDPASVVVGNNGTDRLTAADLNGDGLTDLIGPSGVMGALAKNSVTLLRSGGSNVISGNTGIGIELAGPQATGNLIEGNYVGTNALGTAALANSAGVEMDTGAANNTIGGSAAARNVISGNTNNGVIISGKGSNANAVAGNYIGTNAAGTAALANTHSGVVIQSGATANLIGGPTAGSRNVLSGNNFDGVGIQGSGTSGNLIENNYIGLDATGTAAVANHNQGVDVFGGASGNVIGGDTGKRNVISGNIFQGVVFANPGTNNNIVAGNWIGLNAVGTAAVPNGTQGVLIVLGAQANIIGTNGDGVNDANEGNVIAGNHFHGVVISDQANGTSVSAIHSSNNIIAGNFIGTNAAGTGAIPNPGDGIFIAAGASGNRIGTNGDGVSDTLERNVISGNGGTGVYINGPSANNNVVAGNFVGVDVGGNTALGNHFFGVALATGVTGNRIGTNGDGVNDAAERNIISANTYNGVFISDPTTTGNVVAGNYIGVGADGTTALGNSSGVLSGIPQAGVLILGGSNNTIGGSGAGAGNVISGNTNSGIDISGSGASGNVVAGNLIGTDAGGNSPIGNGEGVSIESAASNNTIGGVAPGVQSVVTSGNLLGNVYGVAVEKSGDLILPDSFNAQVVRVNPQTGVQTVLSSGGHFTTPDGVALAANGTIYVADSGFGGTPAIIAVDPASGAQTVVSSGGMLVSPGDLTFGPDGNLYVSDPGADGGAGAIIRVNPTTGTQTVVTEGPDGTDTSLPAQLTFDPAGNILAVYAPNVEGPSEVDRIDPATGTRTVLSSGGLLFDSLGIAIDRDGSLLVTNIAGPGASFGDIVRINATTGAQSLAYSGGDLFYPYEAAVAPDGDLYVTNYTAGTDFTAQVVRIAANAARNVISGNTDNGIEVSQSNGNVIQGNYLGTNAAGTTGVGNASRGILVVGVSGTPVTGTVITGNVVSANGIGSPLASGIRLNFDSGTLVQGNRIGTDASGTVALGNDLSGLRLLNSTGDTVGGTTPGAGNLISGNLTRGVTLDNATGNVIQGNLIGVGPNGATALANGAEGILIHNASSANTVGGTTAGSGNVISGNQANGITITDAGSVNNLLQGNIIGNDSAGTAAIPNAGDGVFLKAGADGTTIGGAAGARNVISGNALSGIHVQSNGTVIAGNYVGTNAAGSAALGNTQRGIFIDGNNPTIITGTVITGNVVSGNGFGFTTASGIRLESDTGTRIQGNTIGTDVTGTVALGNAVSGLYLIDSTNDTVGGTAAGAGNLISGNGQHGLTLNDATGNLIQGNLIGVAADGVTPLGNVSDGVTISIASPNNTVGGTVAGAGNLIASNGGNGISFTSPGTTGNLVEGNLIGTNSAGANLGNLGSGISLLSGAANNTLGGVAVGAANTIAFNKGNGVIVSDGQTTGVTVRGNLIHDNVGLSIDLTNGGNDTLAAPVITSFTPGLPTTVTGFLNVSTAAQTVFTLDFYAASGPATGTPGQSQVYLGSLTLTTDVNGLAAFTATLSASTSAGQVVSATATKNDPTRPAFPANGDTTPFAAEAAAAGYHNTNPIVTINGPANVVANTPVSLSSTITDATKGKTYTYTWSVTEPAVPSFALPASTITDEPSLVFTPPTPGTYVATLHVTDNLGGSATATLTLVAHVPGPGVVIKGAPGAPIATGTPVKLTSAVAEPTGATPTSYAWTVTFNNGQPFSPGTPTNGTTFSFTPTVNSLYEIGLTVLDSSGAASSTSVFVLATSPGILQPPPTAAITSAPVSALVGHPVTLTGTVTMGATLTWGVTLNGQSYALPPNTPVHGSSFTFTPTQTGSYVVTLTAVNAAGTGLAVAKFTANPAIVPVGLTAINLPFEAPALARVDADVLAPAPGVNYSFTWNVTPASPFSTTQLSPSSSAFTLTAPTNAGTYTVSVQVAGSDGSTGTASQVISVAAPLSGTITERGGAASSRPLGTPVTYTAHVSGGAGTVKYNWSVTLNGQPYALPAGTKTKVPTFTFTPDQFGSFVVTLSLSDGAGASAQASDSFSTAPAIVLSNSVVTGSTFMATLTTVAPNVPPGDTITYSWSVNAGAPTSGLTFSLTGNTGTQFTVTLTISDNGTPVGTATLVLNFAPANTTITAPDTDTTVLLVAGGGNDTLKAGSGPTILMGDTGNNLLLGGTGNDTLIGTGSDTLMGGTGPSNLFQINTIGGEQITAVGNNNTLSFTQVIGGVSVSLTGSTGSVTAPGGTVTLSGAFQTVQGSDGGNNILSATNVSGLTLFGGSGNDTLSSSGGTSVSMVGGSGNETLVSSGGSSITMFGGTGNDSLLASGATSVTMVSGGGNTTLSSSGGSSVTMFGSTGNDSLRSSGGTSVSMVGGSGNETLVSSGGSSITMFGGTGNDSLLASGATSVTMVSGGGNTTLSSSSGSSVTMFGGTGNDSLQSAGGTSVSMVGGSGNETLVSSGGTSITMFGGTGNDSLTSSGGTSVTMVSGGGNTTLSSSGGSSVTMFGGTGNDSLQSSGGTSVSMVGGSGNETLVSSGGSSITMFGGTGNDSLLSSGGTSVTMVSGGGNTTLSSSGGSSVTMFGGTGNDSLQSSGGTSVSMVGGSGNETLVSSGGSSITMFGGSGNDTLTSSGATSVTMVGGGGNDSLSSTNGSNVQIQTGSGAGGTGVATVTGGTSITMFGGAGNDSLQSSGSTSVTMVGGSGNETLVSSGGSSVTMFGGAGNDSLNASGGTGVTMVGGTGNDSLTNGGGNSVLMLGTSQVPSVTKLTATADGTFTAVVSGNSPTSLTPSGSVDFFDATTNTELGRAALTGGSAILAASGLTAGDSITATYSGDVNFATSSAAQTQGIGLTTTVLTSVLTSPASGAVQTFIATVSADAGGAASGTVTFLDATTNTNLPTTGTLVNGSVSTSAVSAASVAGHRIVAAYAPAAGFVASSASQTLIGSTTLSSSGGSSVTMFGGTGNDSLTSSGGSSVTMIGGSGNDTLSGTGNSSITLFGGTGNDSLSSSGGTSVTMIGGSGNDSLSSTGGTNVSVLGGSGDSTLTSSGGTSVTLFGGTGNDSLQSSGGSSVTMVGGTGSDTLSSSGGSSILIIGGNQIVSTMTLTSTASGSGVTFTATVSGNTPIANTPVGVVDFFDTTTGADLGSAALSGGRAVLAAQPGAGDNITATYGGDGVFTPAAATQTLGPSRTPTTIALTFASNGQNIVFTANVSADGTSGTPTGMVTFLDVTANQILGSATLDIHGTASTPVLLQNAVSPSDRVTATYSGDNSFAPSSAGQTLGGNATLSSSGGTSVTMFGGTGNDSLSSSGGSSVSMTGGSGNDTLSSTGGTNVTLQGGGAGNDSILSSGGSSITLFGGSGNDTLLAAGGNAVGLFGLEGNNLYELVGSGNPASPSDFSLNDLATIGTNQSQADNQTLGTNTIEFPALSNLSPGQTGIRLDLSNTSPGPIPRLSTDPGQPQAVASDITVSLTGQFQNVIGTPGDDWIHGGASSNLLDGDGSGNDTLIGGSGPATLIAGSGNDSLVAGTGGTTFRFAGAPTDFSNVTIDPPTGNALNALDFSQYRGSVSVNLGSTSPQTVSGSGLRLTLQNPAEVNGVFGTTTRDSNGNPFDNTIIGNTAGDTFYFGNGNDTFTGAAARGGADTFIFNGSLFGSDAISEPSSTNNSLNFYGFGGPINLDLTNSGSQTLNHTVTTIGGVPTVLSNLQLTLAQPGAFSTVIGTTYNDTIRGNATANQVLIGGGGSDSLVAGNGSVSVRGNVTQIVYLDFPLAGSSSNLASGAGPTDTRTTLTRVGTTFSAAVVATGTPSRTPTGTVDFFDTTTGTDLGIVPLVGGSATLSASTGSDIVTATYSGENPAGDHVYTADEENAILQGVEADYADFDYFFTLDPTVAAQKAQVTGGQFVTIAFNAGGVQGGASNVLDPGNLDLGGTTIVNVNSFVGTGANLVPATDPTTGADNFIGLTTTIAAHELGHQSGLQHQDAFGLIGTGVFSGVSSNGVDFGVNPDEFFPTYTGPLNPAGTTPQDIMASPASVGTTLQDAAGTTFFGERDAIKLAFNDTGTVLQQQNLVLGSVRDHSGPSDLANAYYVPTNSVSVPLSLAPLAVPNTLPASVLPAGTTFNVTAVAINGTLQTNTQEDFYAFSGTANQLMTFQVISNNNTLNTHPIVPELVLVDPNGHVIGYNVHEFESADSTLLDVKLPTDGTYYVGVDSLLSLTAGNYQLFMYSFSTTGSSGATGDTMVGGTGNDTMFGSSGNDQFFFPQGATGNATLFAGSGQNTLDLTGAPGEHVTLVPPDKFTIINSSRVVTNTTLASSANPSVAGKALTLTATVTAASGTPAGSVDFFDTSTNTDLGSVTVGSGGLAKLTLSSGLSVGTHTITATFAPSASSSFLGSQSAPLVQTVTLTSTAGTSAYILSSSAAGALSVSGQAQLALGGLLEVNSSSTSAISLSGSGQVTAGAIQVVGKVQTSGNAHITPSNPTTGVVPFGDPLSNLPLPPSGLPLKGSVSVSGSTSLTINPGIYSQISVSGSGKLTMNPGIYIIAGGGFTVTDLGSVTGNGVMIYNAGSSYPNAGGSFGAVNLSGNGTISLTAPAIGPYTGILIFQSRDNTRALSLSGNGIVIPSGVIYAPKAALTITGRGQFSGSFVVNTLSISGNSIAQLTAGDGSGTVYAPSQVRTAYGINNLSLDGTGQTIAIVDAYDDPAIYAALDAFDAQFGVASSGTTLDQLYGAASSFLTVVNQRGDATALPAADPAGPGSDNWEVEEALDVEWAHAVAPGAKIVLVEADSQSLSDLMTAVKTAAGLPGVSVVSMSWGFPEGLSVFAQDEALYDSYLTTPAGHPGVTFVASTGDYGAGLPLYPAFSPKVVAVGGTSLTLNADNSYKTEVGWGAYSDSLGVFLGGGGGLSQFEAEPAFQQGVQSTGSRATPDVSLLADPATGVWVADPYNLSADSPWVVVGGTSLSAPAWAALLALVNQGRVASGKATLGTAGPIEAQTALYGLSAADFHDVNAGSNGYSAGTGFDLVTGLGSPVADLLVADLVAFDGGPVSPTPVAPIAPAGLVLSGGVNSAGATAQALTQAAVLRVFSAQPLMSHTPAAADEETLPAVLPRPTVAQTSGSGAAAVERGAAIETHSPISGFPQVGLTAAAVALAVGSSLPPTIVYGNAPAESVGVPVWSAVLLDPSSVTDPVSVLTAGALRPVMPADRDHAALDALMAEGWGTDGWEGVNFFGDYFRSDDGE